MSGALVVWSELFIELVCLAFGATYPSAIEHIGDIVLARWFVCKFPPIKIARQVALI